MWISTDRDSIISSHPWLQIIKENYGIGYVWDLLEKDDLGTIKFARGGTIVGRVLDAQEKAVPNCEVCVCDSWPNRLATAQTDGREDTNSKECRTVGCSRRTPNEPLPELLKVTVYARANPA